MTAIDGLLERVQEFYPDAFVWHSGGGVMLIRIPISDQMYALIDDPAYPEEGIRLGIYGPGEDDNIVLTAYKDADALMEQIRALN